MQLIQNHGIDLLQAFFAQPSEEAVLPVFQNESCAKQQIEIEDLSKNWASAWIGICRFAPGPYFQLETNG